jgi:hypothetical protein
MCFRSKFHDLLEAAGHYNEAWEFTRSIRLSHNLGTNFIGSVSVNGDYIANIEVDEPLFSIIKKEAENEHATEDVINS